MKAPNRYDYPSGSIGNHLFTSALCRWQGEEIKRLIEHNERLRDMVAQYADRYACIDTGHDGKLESFMAARPE